VTRRHTKAANLRVLDRRSRCVSGIRRASRFDKQQVHFLLCEWPVLDAPGYHVEIARAQPYRARSAAGRRHAHAYIGRLPFRDPADAEKFIDGLRKASLVK
jgi:hypothetical protein